MKRISIVGYGRFGKVLHRLVKDDFAVTLYNTSKITDHRWFTSHTFVAKNIRDVYQSEVIFYAVPIEFFEEVIAHHKQYFQAHHLIIDVLSVKLYPQKILNKHLKGLKTQALLTHPLFGPDSSKSGFSGLPIVLDRFKTNQKNYAFWSDFFARKGLVIVELSAREHDKMAARSQGVTHLIGRLLEAFQFEKTPIDTVGARKLQEVMDQTCNDTWDLFLNLQTYNPYTKSVQKKLKRAYDTLYNKIFSL